MSPTTSTTTTHRPLETQVVIAEGHNTELIDVHRRAGLLVAELSDGPIWVDAVALVDRLVAEAATVARCAPRSADGERPAVVLCRELAVAQRQMVAAIEAGSANGADEAAVVRTRALVAELGELAARSRATLPR